MLKELFCLHYWTRQIYEKDFGLYETSTFIKFDFVCKKCFRQKIVIVNPKFPFKIKL